jgi:rubrerythrin
MKKWMCTICGHVHKGEEPPDVCPTCGAQTEDFIELD